MGEQGETRIAFGPAGLAGPHLASRFSRGRFIALLGLAGVVADVAVAELGGFKAMNEARSAPPRTSPRSSSCAAGYRPA